MSEHISVRWKRERMARLAVARQRLADGGTLKELSHELGMSGNSLYLSIYREIKRLQYNTLIQWVVAGCRTGEVK